MYPLHTIFCSLDIPATNYPQNVASSTTTSQKCSHSHPTDSSNSPTPSPWYTSNDSNVPSKKTLSPASQYSHPTRMVYPIPIPISLWKMPVKFPYPDAVDPISFRVDEWWNHVRMVMHDVCSVWYRWYGCRCWKRRFVWCDSIVGGIGKRLVRKSRNREGVGSVWRLMRRVRRCCPLRRLRSRFRGRSKSRNWKNQQKVLRKFFKKSVRNA